jgi:hypothetical protein
VGRVDIAVRCMVVNINCERVRVEMDLVAPWITMGALKCSKTNMMRAVEASKVPLNTTPSLE